MYVLCLWSDWFCRLTWQRVDIYVRRVWKCVFAYDLSLTVLSWPCVVDWTLKSSYYYYYYFCFQPTACSLFRSYVRGNRRGHPSHGREWVNSPARGLQSRPVHPGLHPTEAYQHRQHLGGGSGGGYPPHDGMGGLHWGAGARWVVMAECSCSALKALALSQGLTHVYYPFILIDWWSLI